MEELFSFIGRTIFSILFFFIIRRHGCEQLFSKLPAVGRLHYSSGRKGVIAKPGGVRRQMCTRRGRNAASPAIPAPVKLCFAQWLSHSHVEAKSLFLVDNAASGLRHHAHHLSFRSLLKEVHLGRVITRRHSWSRKEFQE